MSNIQSRHFCLGIDPRPGFHQSSFLNSEFSRLGCVDFWAKVLELNLEVFQKKAKAVKFQSAFFENMGQMGFSTLKKCVEVSRTLLPEGEVILDFKRSDIGSTMEAYLELAFSTLGADTITVLPYYGMSTLSTWQKSKFRDRSIFLVAVGTEVDEQSIQFEFMSQLLNRLEESYLDKIGLVVGANLLDRILNDLNFKDNFRKFRWLVPGVGAQGAVYEETLLRINPPDRSLISSSREATGISENAAFQNWGDYKKHLISRELTLPF